MIPDVNQETSKTSSINALIVRAWRERWSDLQWGINIKTVLPRGISGDVYNLGECILQQATTGSGINQLLLSYLKHSLSSQLISYAAVLKHISKFEQFQKPFCIMQFLQFFESIQASITCRSKPEEILMPSSIILFANWLLKTISYFKFKNPHLNYHLLVSEDISEKAIQNLRFICESDFLASMLYLGRFLEKESFEQSIEIVDEMEKSLPDPQFEQLLDLFKARLHRRQKNRIENEPFNPKGFLIKSLNYSIQIILMNFVTHESLLSIDRLLRQLLVVKRLQNLSIVQLNYEIMRASFYSLANACDTKYEKCWGAFVFIFIPKVLRKLQTIYRRTTTADPSPPSIDELLTTAAQANEPGENFSNNIVHALELLLKHSDLLNMLDVRSSSNCFEYFLHELQKVQLLNESLVKYFMETRKIPEMFTIDFAEPQNPGIRKFIVKAEQSLVGILKTLNGDNYAKAYEALSGMLSQMLSTKSLDLILSVAKADGKLQVFTSKLITFNENALKQIDLNTCIMKSQNATYSKAIFFDVSFIILCSIVDKFGFDVIPIENQETYFAKWARENLRRKRLIGNRYDPVSDDVQKVEQIIQFLCTATTNENILQTKWQQVLQSIPDVMQQVIIPWEHGILKANTLQTIVESLRKFKLCSLLVSAATWLSAQPKIGSQERTENLIAELLAPFPLTTEEGTSAAADDDDDDDDDDQIVSIEHLNDRMNTVFEIVKRLQHDDLDVLIPKTRYLSMSSNMADLIDHFWQSIYDSETIDSDLAIRFKYLFETSGSSSFVKQLTKEIFNNSSETELDKTVDLVFGLFSFFIEDCTIVLINDILPTYLFNKAASANLNIPQSLALAKLVVSCVNMCLETTYASCMIPTQSSAAAAAAPAKKRTFPEPMESNETGSSSSSSSKVLKIADNSNETAATAAGAASETVATETAAPPVSNENNIVTAVIHEFFYRCETLLTQNQLTLSKQMFFIVNLLLMTADKMTDCKTFVFRQLSATIVPTFLKSMPDLFTFDLVLELYDKETVTGVNNASRDLCLLRNHQLRK